MQRMGWTTYKLQLKKMADERTLEDTPQGKCNQLSSTPKEDERMTKKGA